MAMIMFPHCNLNSEGVVLFLMAELDVGFTFTELAKMRLGEHNLEGCLRAKRHAELAALTIRKFRARLEGSACQQIDAGLADLERQIMHLSRRVPGRVLPGKYRPSLMI